MGKLTLSQSAFGRKRNSKEPAETIGPAGLARILGRQVSTVHHWCSDFGRGRSLPAGIQELLGLGRKVGSRWSWDSGEVDAWVLKSRISNSADHNDDFLESLFDLATRATADGRWEAPALVGLLESSLKRPGEPHCPVRPARAPGRAGFTPAEPDRTPPEAFGALVHVPGELHPQKKPSNAAIDGRISNSADHNDDFLESLSDLAFKAKNQGHPLAGVLGELVRLQAEPFVASSTPAGTESHSTPARVGRVQPAGPGDVVCVPGDSRTCERPNQEVAESWVGEFRKLPTPLWYLILTTFRPMGERCLQTKVDDYLKRLSPRFGVVKVVGALERQKGQLHAHLLVGGPTDERAHERGFKNKTDWILRRAWSVGRVEKVERVDDREGALFYVARKFAAGAPLFMTVLPGFVERDNSVGEVCGAACAAPLASGASFAVEAGSTRATEVRVGSDREIGTDFLFQQPGSLSDESCKINSYNHNLFHRTRGRNSCVKM